MKTKVSRKIRIEILSLCLFLLSMGKFSRAEENLMFGNVLNSESLSISLVFGVFKWLEMVILAPMVLVWLIAYAVYNSYKKKGRDLSEAKKLFQVFDVGLIFAGLLSLILFVSSYYFSSIEIDYDTLSYYSTTIFYITGISMIVMYLWMFLHCARYRSIMKKKNKLLIKNNGNQKNGK